MLGVKLADEGIGEKEGRTGCQENRCIWGVQLDLEGLCVIEESAWCRDES